MTKLVKLLGAVAIAGVLGVASAAAATAPDPSGHVPRHATNFPNYNSGDNASANVPGHGK